MGMAGLGCEKEKGGGGCGWGRENILGGVEKERRERWRGRRGTKGINEEGRGGIGVEE